MCIMKIIAITIIYKLLVVLYIFILECRTDNCETCRNFYEDGVQCTFCAKRYFAAETHQCEGENWIRIAFHVHPYCIHLIKYWVLLSSGVGRRGSMEMFLHLHNKLGGFDKNTGLYVDFLNALNFIILFVDR